MFFVRNLVCDNFYINIISLQKVVYTYIYIFFVCETRFLIGTITILPDRFFLHCKHFTGRGCDKRAQSDCVSNLC